MSELGDVLRTLREKRGLSQTQLARRVGVTQQAIHQYETGTLVGPRYRERLFSTLAPVDDDERRLLDELYSAAYAAMSAGAEKQMRDVITDLYKKEASITKESETNKIVNVKYKSEKSEQHKSIFSKNIPVLRSGILPSGEMYIENINIEVIPTPHTLIDVANAFAVYIYGNQFDPSYKQGDLIFLHPSLPPRPGDDLLIIEDSKDNTRRAYFGSVVSKEDRRINVEIAGVSPDEAARFTSSSGVQINVIMGKFNRR
ncbi:MAG: helix-turn-helix domain-containing protein [Alphaproteobacteria bacterium]